MSEEENNEEFLEIELESIEEEVEEEDFYVLEDVVSEPPPAPPEEEEPPKEVIPVENGTPIKKQTGKVDHLFTEIEPLIMAAGAGRVTRRQIRYRLFRIREGGRIREAYDLGLKSFMEAQFTSEMTWENFTFEWDVAPNNPLKVIPKDISNYEWLDLGGKFDGADKKVPPAFSQQK